MGKILMQMHETGHYSMIDHEGAFEYHDKQPKFNDCVLRAADKLNIPARGGCKENFYAIHEVEHIVLNIGFKIADTNPVGITQFEGCLDEIYSWTMRKNNRFNSGFKNVWVVFSYKHGWRFFDFNSEKEFYESTKGKVLTVHSLLDRMESSKMSNLVKKNIHKRVMVALHEKFDNPLTQFENKHTEEIVKVVVETAFPMMNHHQEYMTEEGEKLWYDFNRYLKLEMYKAARAKIADQNKTYRKAG